MMRVLLQICLVVVFASCVRDSSSPVPRPSAYYRVELCDTVYAPVADIPLRFEANVSADVKTNGGAWLDIAYPRYGATVFVTMSNTSADSLRSIMDNRRERIRLNISDGAGATVSEIESSGFSSIMIKAPETRTTPLQFISTDNRRWVVSGAVFFHNVTPDAPIDSLSPLVAAVERDIIHALENLSTYDCN